MIRIEIENKLTPAAKQALNELTEEYRSEVLTKAKNIAQELDGEIKEISTKDIIQAINLVNKTTIHKRTSIREKYFTLISFLGIVYAIGGFLYYFVKNNYINIYNDVGLIVGISGLVISIFSLFIRNTFKLYKEEKIAKSNIQTEFADYSYQYEVILLWQNIEYSLREMISKKLGESKADMPLSSMITYLEKTGSLSKSDIEDLFSLLETRNQIAHKNKKYSNSDLRDIYKKGIHILNKLTVINQM